MLGRGRFSLFDRAGGNGKRLSLGKLREGTVLLALFRVCPPTHMKDCFPFGGKGISAAVQPCLGLQIDEGRADRHKHLTGNKAQDLPFACGQGFQICFARRHRGNDGVVVADLFAAAHLPRTDGCGRLRAADARTAQRQRVYAALHIVGEIAAVGAGVGAELLFVETLQIIQRLLRRVPKQAVRIPLEGGQVVERRGFLRLFCLHDGGNSGGFAVAVPGKPLRLCLLLHAPACGGEAVKVQMDGIEGLRLKGIDLRFSLHQQRKRGRYHAPHVQGAVVHHGKQAGGVDAHQPVRLAAAEGGGVEVVVLRTVAEIVKALKNRRILHGGDPEPLYALAAVVESIRRAEDQLALAPGVAGVDHFIHIVPVHEGAQGVHLLLLVPRHGVLPAFRQNGQVLPSPFAVLFIVSVRVRKLRKMPEAPGNEIAAARKKAVLAPACAKNGGNAPCHGGLFTHNKPVTGRIHHWFLSSSLSAVFSSSNS